MGTLYWMGDATAVQQETRATPASVEVDDVFNLLIDGEIMVTFTATAATVANVTAGLETEWNAATHPYAAAITATDQTTYLELKADVAGVPFTITSSTVDGGGTDDQTLTMTTPTANAGPNDWSTALNWSTGAVPVNADDVIIAGTDVDICWGLAQSAVTLASLSIHKSYTGLIGLNRCVFAKSSDGHTTVDTSKTEYRQTYLDIGWDVADIGLDESPSTADGSARLKLDNAKAGASTTTVHSVAAAAAEDGLPALRMLFNHATAVLYVRSANAGCGIAVDTPGETATVGIVSVSDTTTATRVTIGAGTTIATYEQRGGTNLLQAAATVANVRVQGGVLTTTGDYTITGLYNGLVNADDTVTSGGIAYVNNNPTSGNAVTIAYLNAGTTDTTRSNEDRTWDLVNQRSAATFTYDEAVLTINTLNEDAG